MIAKGILGRGFKGTAAYLLHDKARARTAERVAWTHTENLRTDSPQRAWKDMFWTAEHAETLKRESGQSRAGRKAELPVYHLSLSWAPDETPGREEMVNTAREALKTLGLEHHQALIVCHNDEPHSHVHILVNRVNPETGVMNRLSRSNRKLSAWALEYEQAQGRVRCEQRLESNQALERGQKPRHADKVIRDAWSGSDSGRAFQSALAEQGYILAQGNKRIVVVDPTGKAINPTRHLRGVKAAEMTARLADLDHSALPTVEAAQARQQAAAKAREAERQREAAQREQRDQAVGKEEAGVLREAFARAADKPEQAQAQGGGEDRAPEPPLREDYNADWEQAVIDAAIEQAALADHRRERTQQTAGGSGERGGGHAGDSAREHFQERAGPSPTPANDNAPDGPSANKRRAALQSRHFDEQIALERQQNPARLREFERLAAFYDTGVYQAELRVLERKRFKLPWHRERMEELRLTIADAGEKHTQAQDSFTNGQARERADLLTRQAQERLVLEREIAALPEAVRVSEAEREAQARMEQAAQERALLRQEQRLRQGAD